MKVLDKNRKKKKSELPGSLLTSKPRSAEVSFFLSLSLFCFFFADVSFIFWVFSASQVPHPPHGEWKDTIFYSLSQGQCKTTGETI